MKSHSITIALVAVLACAACRSSSAHEQDAMPAPSAPSDPHVEAELEMLDPRILGQGEARALEFALRNRTSDRVEFLFSVDWFDAKGNPVPLSSRAWNRLAIEGQASQPVRVDLMPQEARSWRLRFASTEHHH